MSRPPGTASEKKTASNTRRAQGRGIISYPAKCYLHTSVGWCSSWSRWIVLLLLTYKLHDAHKFCSLIPPSPTHRKHTQLCPTDPYELYDAYGIFLYVPDTHHTDLSWKHRICFFCSPIVLFHESKLSLFLSSTFSESVRYTWYQNPINIPPEKTRTSSWEIRYFRKKKSTCGEDRIAHASGNYLVN